MYPDRNFTYLTSLAYVNSEIVIVGFYNGDILVLNALRGEIIKEIWKSSHPTISCVSIKSTADLVAIGYRRLTTGKINVFNAVTGETMESHEFWCGDGHSPTNIYFLPDRDSIIAAYDSGGICQFGLDNNKPLAIFRHPLNTTDISYTHTEVVEFMVEEGILDKSTVSIISPPPILDTSRIRYIDNFSFYEISDYKVFIDIIRYYLKNPTCIYLQDSWYRYPPPDPELQTKLDSRLQLIQDLISHLTN